MHFSVKMLSSMRMRVCVCVCVCVCVRERERERERTWWKTIINHYVVLGNLHIWSKWIPKRSSSFSLIQLEFLKSNGYKLGLSTKDSVKGKPLFSMTIYYSTWISVGKSAGALKRKGQQEPRRKAHTWLKWSTHFFKII